MGSDSGGVEGGARSRESSSLGHAGLSLTVLSGPDLGQSARFDTPRVRIGRDVGNDFVLRDRYVSNAHGELRRIAEGFVYQDLQSRHGSLVRLDTQAAGVRLQGDVAERSIVIPRRAELQVGSTVLEILVERPREPLASVQELQSSETQRAAREGDDRYIMATQTSMEALSRRFTGRDPRMEILFRLSSRLNAMNRLEEVIDLIVEASFEVFPAASLFAISLTGEEGGALSPFLTRQRRGGDGGQVILSRSILDRVVRTREAVLYVRDSTGGDISRSIVEARIAASLCAPLVGQRSLLGVMQVDSRSLGTMFTQDDLELFTIFASSVAFAMERARLTENIYQMFEGFVSASVSAIEARDPTTAGHSSRVAHYSLVLARHANLSTLQRFDTFQLSERELTELRYAALLHDFGKVGVREAVLVKGQRIDDAAMELIRQRFDAMRHMTWRRLTEPLLKHPAPDRLALAIAQHDALCAELDQALQHIDLIRALPSLTPQHLEIIRALAQRTLPGLDGQPLHLLTPREAEHLSIRFGTLSEEEWENMRSHAAQSEDYLLRIPWSDELKRIPCIAGAHHEKLDGSGYPRQLLAPQIPDQVRILTITDIFDAVTAWDRPYRKAASVDQAVHILQAEARSGKLDPDLVDLFVDEALPEIVPLIPTPEER